jgi:hypothetical protein
MRDELQDFRRKLSDAGRVTYAARCVYRKLDSAILVMKATENWV